MTQPRTTSPGGRTRRSASRTSSKRAASAQAHPSDEQQDGGLPLLTPTIGHLPVPSVRVTHVRLPRAPHMHVAVPHIEVPSAARRSVQGRRGMLLWWAGLAGAAAVGVLEWPVAAAVGAGTYVAERLSRKEDQPMIPAQQDDEPANNEKPATSNR